MTMQIPEPLMPSEAHAVLDIADMIRRDGHRQYGATVSMPACAWQASLCGVTAVFGRDNQVLALRTHDMHVDIALTAVPVDEADGIARYKATRMDVATLYHKGDIQMLSGWHRHLCAYRRSMHPGHTAIAA